MKKFLAALLIVLICASTAQADLMMKVGTQAFKTLTFTGVTLQLDTATGFITQSSIDLRPYQNRKITIQKDGSNYVVAWIGGQSAGGETYGAEANPDVNFGSIGSWTLGSGWSISNNTLSAASVANNISAYIGGVLTKQALWKFVYTCSSDTAGSYAMRNTGVSSGPSHTGTGSIVDYYATPDGSHNSAGIISTATLTAFFTSLSVKQVLTPSNGSTSGQYGAILTSTKGGPQGVTSVTGSPWNAGTVTVILSAS